MIRTRIGMQQNGYWDCKARQSTRKTNDTCLSKLQAGCCNT